MGEGLTLPVSHQKLQGMVVSSPCVMSKEEGRVLRSPCGVENGREGNYPPPLLSEHHGRVMPSRVCAKSNGGGSYPPMSRRKRREGSNRPQLPETSRQRKQRKSKIVGAPMQPLSSSPHLHVTPPHSCQLEKGWGGCWTLPVRVENTGEGLCSRFGQWRGW